MAPSYPLPEQKRQRKRLRFILQIALSAALGGFLFGYDTAVINGAVGAIGEVFNISSDDLGRAGSQRILANLSDVGDFGSDPTFTRASPG